MVKSVATAQLHQEEDDDDDYEDKGLFFLITLIRLIRKQNCKFGNFTQFLIYFIRPVCFDKHITGEGFLNTDMSDALLAPDVFIQRYKASIKQSMIHPLIDPGTYLLLLPVYCLYYIPHVRFTPLFST